VCDVPDQGGSAAYQKSYDDKMDVDSDDEIYLDYYDDDDDDESFMPETKLVLVGEDNLESALCPFLPLIQYKPASESQFSRIFSPYIYALSPAPIRVSSLLNFLPSLTDLLTNKKLFKFDKIRTQA